MLVTKTTYADTTVEEGQTYYYVVTATDTAGSVSSYSNEVSVQIPGGPIMISPTAPPGGTVGASYSAKLSITGGTPPYNCTWKGLAAGIASDSCALSGTPTSMGKYSVGVTVTDSAIPPRSATASFPVEIELPSDGFWSDKTTPANITGNDSQSVEVGLRFKSSIAGAVKAIRFYRATNSAETNIVHLWGPSGKSLATADAPAGPGWITVPLTHPVPITPGKTYTASYHTLQYAWNSDFFSAPLVSGPLTAPVNAGVYRYGSKSAFPSSIYQASNYWVDVVFVAEGKAAAASR